MSARGGDGPAAEPIVIAGAGVAGLAAAVTLARAGRRVIVYEKLADVGGRFGADFQGLESWTTRDDALSVLDRRGITTDFPVLPCTRCIAFDPQRKAHEIESDTPFLYLVERGPNARSLDTALLEQAVSLGVDVRFNSGIDHIVGPGIVATGPRATDALSVGYHFSTDLENGFWLICDDDLAPQGYAYLLVWDGRGTVKSCMFSDFKGQKTYVERTVEAFRTLLGLEMKEPRRHGGLASLRIPRTAYDEDGHPMVGERAGFQDSLWGFGIRLSITSGVLAARSLIDGTDYDRSWRRELRPQMQASRVNRALFSILGNRGYGPFLAHVAARKDPREFLRRWYAPSLAKRALLPWAKRRRLPTPRPP